MGKFRERKVCRPLCTLILFFFICAGSWSIDITVGKRASNIRISTSWFIPNLASLPHRSRRTTSTPPNSESSAMKLSKNCKLSHPSIRDVHWQYICSGCFLIIVLIIVLQRQSVCRLWQSYSQRHCRNRRASVPPFENTGLSSVHVAENVQEKEATHGRNRIRYVTLASVKYNICSIKLLLYRMNISRWPCVLFESCRRWPVSSVSNTLYILPIRPYNIMLNLSRNVTWPIRASMFAP